MHPEKNLSLKERIFTTGATFVPFGGLFYTAARGREVFKRHFSATQSDRIAVEGAKKEYHSRIRLTEKITIPLIDVVRTTLFAMGAIKIYEGDSLTGLACLAVQWAIGVIELQQIAQRFDMDLFK